MFALIPIFVLLFFFGMTTAKMDSVISEQKHDITQAKTIGSESQMLAFSDDCILWAEQTHGMVGSYVSNGTGGVYNGTTTSLTYQGNPTGLGATAPYPMTNALFPKGWECVSVSNGIVGRNIVSIFPSTSANGISPGAMSALLADSGQDLSWMQGTTSVSGSQSYISNAQELSASPMLQGNKNGNSVAAYAVNIPLPTPVPAFTIVVMRWVSVAN